MIIPDKLGKKIHIGSWYKVSQVRRLPVLLVVLGTLLVMGFYAATDSSHLAHAPVLAGADWLGYGLCHRITERSFMINGRQLPLCARCTGMYLGVALAFLVLWLAGRTRYSDLPPVRVLLVLLGFVGLMGIDGLNSYSHFFPNAPHLYEPRNWLRLATGMGTGLAMGALVSPALGQTLWRRQEYRPSIGNMRELANLLLVAGAAVLLLLSNQPVLLYVLAIVSVAGMLFIVAALNAIMLLMLFRLDGRAIMWWQAAVPLCIGIVLAVIELSVIGLVRFNLTATMTGFPGL